MSGAASLRAAIVGAGPAGFYAADALLEAGFAVDVLEALPTPFGLVRSGVAPDHPKIKSVTRIYARIATHPAFRFFGGVRLGRDISREELRARYHAVLYAFGTATDRRLAIPGEDRPGSHAATEFVAWYNGHPDHADRQLALDAARAVVIGNGNVAIDVARMLVLGADELATTDIADHALQALSRPRVQEVVVLGRRGPTQAAFTTPELTELGKLRHADVAIDPAQLDGVAEPDDPAGRRKLELMRDYAGRARSARPHRIELRFLRSPLEILGPGENGPVTGVRVAVNELVERAGTLQAVPTGVEEVIACGLVLRSIGYRGLPVAGIPFDERRGVIANRDGRVCTPDGAACVGEYCVGWIKRGPSGVIGTNKKDAAGTVARLLEDRDAGRLNRPSRGDIADWLAGGGPEHVTWPGWEAIDAHETAAGRRQGRPRVKLVHVDELMAASRGGSQAAAGSASAERSAAA